MQKQDRIEWGHHISPEDEAPLTKNLLFIFMFRVALLKLKTAGWFGPKPWHCFRTIFTIVDLLCSCLKEGFLVGCLLWSQLWARSYLQEQWKVCHLLLLACLCGLGPQKNALTRVVVQDHHALLEEAVDCSVMWWGWRTLPTEQGWWKWLLNKGVELWQY